MSRTILQLCLILTAFQASRATTITFSQPDGSPFGNGSSLPQTCGDRATVPFSGSCSYTVGPEGATPNILLDYGNAPSLNSWTTANFQTWPAYFGSLVDVVYAGGSNYSGIKFEADAGYQLTLMQFDIAGYNGISQQVRWQVFDSLFSSLWDSGLVMAPATGSISLTPGSTGSTLYLIATDGNFTTGLDNLTFSQSAIGQGSQIPEPSTYWMGFSGLALAAFRLRRN